VKPTLVIAAALALLLSTACGDVFTPKQRPRYPIPIPPQPSQKSPPQADLDKPAEVVFKNVQVLQGMTARNFTEVMDSWKKNLGVDCSHCHVADRASDELKNKVAARQMFRMMSYANGQIGLAVVTCDTCHRGKAVPDPRPKPPEIDPMLEIARKAIPLTEEQTSKPAAEVFRNIQVLKSAPAGRFPIIMSAFSNALGVKCSFCHNESDYSADGINKRTARTMLRMVSGAIQQYYPSGDSPINCWQCHQGLPKPDGTP
jgi:photosynthetic reaction center cytochrome c subunit